MIKWNKHSVNDVSVLLSICFALLLAISIKAKADTLEMLIDEAISSHPLVKSQLSQSRAAKVGVETARQQFYPTHSIVFEQASASNSDSSFQGDDNVTRFSLQQPLWTGGRLSAGLDRARSNTDESLAGVDDVRQEVALRVVQAYSEWLSAFLKRQAWEESFDVHLRLRDQVSRRIELGASAKSDLALAQGRLESTRSEAAAVKAQEAVALSSLDQLVGRSLQSNRLAGWQAEPQLLQHGVDELQSHAQSLNPGVKRSLAQVSAIDAEINELKARHWPEVFLRLEHQRGNFSDQNADSESRIFIGLESRFGAGLSNFTNVREARMRRDGALGEVAAQRRAVSEQVSADYSLTASFEIRVQALLSSVKTARSVSESYSRQFLAGGKTWLDVMNAARDLVSTEVQLADAQASQLAVTWRLVIFTNGVYQVLSQKSAYRQQRLLPNDGAP